MECYGISPTALTLIMHPAEEFDAFAVLRTNRGMAAEDIAARLDFNPPVVR
jgi:hypothetical protein